MICFAEVNSKIMVAIWEAFSFFSKRILPPFLNVFLAKAAQSYFYLRAVNLILLRGESRACVWKLAARLAAHQPLRANLVLGHLGKASLNYVPKEAVVFFKEEKHTDMHTHTHALIPISVWELNDEHLYNSKRPDGYQSKWMLGKGQG